MSAPRLSMIMPVRNEELFLRSALNSLLAQTYTDFELIVVDDGSTDGSCDIARSTGDRRVRVIAGPAQGLSAARNAGIAAAVGQLIAFADGDDESEPNRLELQIAALGERHLDAISCAYLPLDARGHAFSPTSYLEDPEAIKWASYSYMPVCGPAMMCRAELFKSAGIFNDAYFPAEDYEWFCRALRRGTIFGAIDLPLYRYRWHSASISQERSTEQRLATRRVQDEHWLALPPRRVSFTAARRSLPRAASPQQRRKHASALLQVARQMARRERKGDAAISCAMTIAANPLGSLAAATRVVLP